VQNFETNVIAIYPNPTNGQFNITLNDNYKKMNVIVYDLNGKPFYMANYENNDFVSINLKSAPGIYVVSIQLDQKEPIIRKIAIQ
jgi:hypothetical protein